MKLGKEVEFAEDFEIETYISKTKLQVKEGDKALITKNGYKILTGEGKGKTINFAGNAQPKGCDCENLSKLILDRLNRVFELEMFFDYEGLDSDEFVEEIEDVLMDIL